MVYNNYLRNMELLGFRLIGCHSTGMTVYYIELPEKEEINHNKEGLLDGKLREIPKVKGKKGIGKETPEGA